MPSRWTCCANDSLIWYHFMFAWLNAVTLLPSPLRRPTTATTSMATRAWMSGNDAMSETNSRESFTSCAHHFKWKYNISMRTTRDYLSRQLPEVAVVRNIWNEPKKKAAATTANWFVWHVAIYLSLLISVASFYNLNVSPITREFSFTSQKTFRNPISMAKLYAQEKNHQPFPQALWLPSVYGPNRPDLEYPSKVSHDFHPSFWTIDTIFIWFLNEICLFDPVFHWHSLRADTKMIWLMQSNKLGPNDCRCNTTRKSTLTYCFVHAFQRLNLHCSAKIRYTRSLTCLCVRCSRHAVRWGLTSSDVSDAFTSHRSHRVVLRRRVHIKRLLHRNEEGEFLKMALNLFFVNKWT